MVLRKRGKPGAAGYIVSAIEKQSDNANPHSRVSVFSPGPQAME